MTTGTLQARRGGRSTKPSLRVERSLHREGSVLVAGMDEVGRGALAGPVSVGIVVIGPSSRSAPAGVQDSKLLTPARRRSLVPRIRTWCHAYGVGHASAAEIDAVGIMAALRMAGLRALSQLDQTPEVIILDGNHDWLTAPESVGLFGFLEHATTTPAVRTRIKADLTCSTVAAASVLAKVARDDQMVVHAEDYPAYHWDENKGYSSPEHLQALARLGPSVLHRRSWRLPGVMIENEAAQPQTAAAAGEPPEGMSR